MSTKLLRETASFVKGSTAKEERAAVIEGVEETGLILIKTLVVGSDIVVLRAFKQKGVIDPFHTHEDHESVGYLESGRLRLVIGEEEFIAEPGDSWLHRAGVPHMSEALEDSVQVECKSPPRKTWQTLAELDTAGENEAQRDGEVAQ